MYTVDNEPGNATKVRYSCKECTNLQKLLYIIYVATAVHTFVTFRSERYSTAHRSGDTPTNRKRNIMQLKIYVKHIIL